MEPPKYSVQLFGQFDQVIKHSTSWKKTIEDLFSFLKQLSTQQENYAKNLERTANMPINLSEDSYFQSGISALKSDCQNKAIQSRIFAENIQLDLIQPLKQLIKSQNSNIKKATTQGNKLQKEKASIQKKLDKSKLRYWKACSYCQQQAILVESADDFNRVRFLDKFIQSKKEVEFSVKSYSDQISSYNIFTSIYNQKQKSLLDSLQAQQEEMLSLTKDTLRKFVVYQTACLRNLQYDVDNLALAMQSINTHSQISDFAKKSATQTDSTLKPIIFQSFQGTHPSFKNLGMSLPIITIPHPGDTLKTPQQQQSIQQQVNQLVSKAWSGLEFQQSDYLEFNSLIKQPKGRQAMISSLNFYKTQGTFFICKQGFSQISELIISMLNECQRVLDYKTVQACINYSQTFHKQTERPNEPKEYLSDYISQHSVWNRMQIWQQIIQSSIDQQIRNQQTYGTSDQSIEKRLKNIVFIQLGSFGHLMVKFQVDTMYSSQILSKYACKYDLSNSDLDILMATVDKTYGVKEKSESVRQVLRGVPDWLQEIEGAAAVISKRIPTKRLSNS